MSDIVGFSSGAEMFVGILAEVTVTGVSIAIFKSNSIVARDNAKKMFESGIKGSGKK